MRYRVLALAALLVAAGCAATVPERTPGGEEGNASPVPAPARGHMSAAGEALLIQSMNERRSGDYRVASATLERALRIDPLAPALWLELARVRLLEGDPAQAEQLARKARALAESDTFIAGQAEKIIAEAARQ